MNRNRPLFALVTILACAACGGDGTGPSDAIATVTVSPLTPTLSIGGNVQFSATAKTSTGSTVSVTFTWSSSAPAVATVSSSGLVTAVAGGQTAITAASTGGVSGSTILTVSSPQNACANAKTVDMAAGGAQTYALSDCIVLPSGAAGDRYRVAVINSSEDDGSGSASHTPLATLSVTGLGVMATPAAVPDASPRGPWASPVAGLSGADFAHAARMAEATERYHLAMRRQEARMIDRIGTKGFLPRWGHGSPRMAAAAAQAGSPAKRIFDTTTSGCTTTPAAKKTGILVTENADMVVYQDSTERTTKPVTTALAIKLIGYYTSYAKKMVEGYWGTPSDLDNNGKVVLFASPVVAGDVAAYVWSGDFFENDTTVEGSCAASNEAEIMYFNTDHILALGDTTSNYQVLSTVAHEMKHVVGLYDRVAASQRVGSNQYNPGWIEEGTAEISGEMSSRIAWAANGGPPTNALVSRTAIATSGITENNYGMAINLARTVWFLSSQPNGLVITPDGAADGSSIYGSGWLFERWLGDSYGNPNHTPQGDSAFFRALTDSSAAPGTIGLANKIGKGYDALLTEFYTEIMLRGTGTPTTERPFATYDFPSVTEIFCDPNPLGVFPWPVTTTGTVGDCSSSPRIDEDSSPAAFFVTKDYKGPIGNGGIRIHEFVSNGTGTGAQIRVDMTPPGKVLVVRLR